MLHNHLWLGLKYWGDIRLFRLRKKCIKDIQTKLIDIVYLCLTIEKLYKP